MVRKAETLRQRLVKHTERMRKVHLARCRRVRTAAQAQALLEKGETLSNGHANCPDQVLSIALPRKPRKSRRHRCLLQLPEEGRLTAKPREGRRKRVGVPRRN